ncbi:MAG: ABC transporter ATP-binding protein [bacterium]|nr:ABC transporter ATP-binding protein [bacterium]
MLQLEEVEVFYGNVRALHGISLHVEEGEIVTLIGSNGAGKTTTLHTISGLLVPRAGTITFEGQPVQGLRADKIIARGIAHSPEGRRIFTNLSVLENLEMGAYLETDRTRTKERLERMFALFPRLDERKNQQGGTLSGGEQQMLAIARALMCGPRLVLLDEPSLGIAPILVQEIFREIKAINEEYNTTILLVEQNANLALKLAHRGYVIETGNIVLEDDASRLLEDPQVKEAYLG